MDPIEETEPNTIVVNVTKDMDKDAVLQEILRRVEEVKAEDKPDGEVVKLLDGYYKSDNHFCGIFKVCQLYSTTLLHISSSDSPQIDGENSIGKDGGDNGYPLTILYGDQGEAHETIQELTGQTRNNIKIKLDWGGGADYVIKSEDGESKVSDIHYHWSRNAPAVLCHK